MAESVQGIRALKGFEESDHYDALLMTQGVGKRYSVTGEETKRALGRKSKAFNPLQAAITQAQEVAVRAEKNRVGKTLYDLASLHSSETYGRFGISRPSGSTTNPLVGLKPALLTLLLFICNRMNWR